MDYEVEDEFLDNNIQEVYKRLPPKFHTSANDVYVTRFFLTFL